MKSLILILLIVFSFFSCYPQWEIKGVLRDMNSGEPVADAQVSADHNRAVSGAQETSAFKTLNPAA